MIKFSNRKNLAIEDYWSYCRQHQIPHIVIIPVGRDYVNISYDLLPSIPFAKLKGDILDKMIKIYESYVAFFKIPKTKYHLAGGEIALGVVIRKEHSEFIANQLFDYLTDYVKNNKI